MASPVQQRPFVLCSPGPMPPSLQRSLVGARVREEQSSYLRDSCVSNIAPSKPGRLPQGGLTFGGGTEQVCTVKLVAGPWGREEQATLPELHALIQPSSTWDKSRPFWHQQWLAMKELHKEGMLQKLRSVQPLERAVQQASLALNSRIRRMCGVPDFDLEAQKRADRQSRKRSTEGQAPSGSTKSKRKASQLATVAEDNSASEQGPAASKRKKAGKAPLGKQPVDPPCTSRQTALPPTAAAAAAVDKRDEQRGKFRKKLGLSRKPSRLSGCPSLTAQQPATQQPVAISDAQPTSMDLNLATGTQAAVMHLDIMSGSQPAGQPAIPDTQPEPFSSSFQGISQDPAQDAAAPHAAAVPLRLPQQLTQVPLDSPGDYSNSQWDSQPPPSPSHSLGGSHPLEEAPQNSPGGPLAPNPPSRFPMGSHPLIEPKDPGQGLQMHEDSLAGSPDLQSSSQEPCCHQPSCSPQVASPHSPSLSPRHEQHILQPAHKLNKSPSRKRSQPKGKKASRSKSQSTRKPKARHGKAAAPEPVPQATELPKVQVANGPLPTPERRQIREELEASKREGPLGPMREMPDGLLLPESACCCPGDKPLESFKDEDDEGAVYVVQAIYAHNSKKGRPAAYRVKWQGYELDPHEWTPACLLKDNEQLHVYQKSLQHA